MSKTTFVLCCGPGTPGQASEHLGDNGCNQSAGPQPWQHLYTCTTPGTSTDTGTQVVAWATLGNSGQCTAAQPLALVSIVISLSEDCHQWQCVHVYQGSDP